MYPSGQDMLWVIVIFFSCVRTVVDVLVVDSVLSALIVTDNSADTLANNAPASVPIIKDDSIPMDVPNSRTFSSVFSTPVVAS